MAEFRAGADHTLMEIIRLFHFFQLTILNSTQPPVATNRWSIRIKILMIYVVCVETRYPSHYASDCQIYHH